MPYDQDQQTNELHKEVSLINEQIKDILAQAKNQINDNLSQISTIKTQLNKNSYNHNKIVKNAASVIFQIDNEAYN